jgi:rhodanese-related sulfurtransferase
MWSSFHNFHISISGTAPLSRNNPLVKDEFMKKLLLFLVFVCFSSYAFAVQSVTAKEAASKVSSERALLIDVRELDEVKTEGLAKPAIWIAKSEIDKATPIYQDFLKSLHKTTPLIFYCRSGKRAQVVAEHFESLGFVTFNSGGFADWVRAGLPVRNFASAY